jgi:hypothetical protein
MFISRDFMHSFAKKEVENIISSCQSAGLGEPIEVCYSKMTQAPPKLNGFEIPVVTMGGGTSISSKFDSSTRFIVGTLKYYPDTAGRCWAYIPATEKNKFMIKHSFALNWFWIVDKAVETQLKSEAKSEGLQTEPIGGIVSIRKNRREVDLEKQKNGLESQLESLAAKVARLEAEKEAALEKLDKEKQKKLSGVTIKNREQAIKNIEAMRESVNAD